MLCAMRIEERIKELGLVLPEPTQAPSGVRLPFAPVRVWGNRAFVAGHGPLNPDGTLAGPFGKVPTEVSPEHAYASARLVGLAMLGSLKRALGDLDRISAWVRVFGMVNATPEFTTHPIVINGCSDLLLELFGPGVGQHARSAVGLASLPFNIPVEIEAELEIVETGGE
jgi:enamine deaminase RidA (YjgF/YER057c/UK114 family)